MRPVIKNLEVYGFDKCFEAAKCLAQRPTKSTEHMSEDDRAAGINQLLTDLYVLANSYGCVAAAWAFDLAMADAAAIRDGGLVEVTRG